MLEQFFPHLSPSNHHITSPRSRRYNCIAWAAGDERKWWWPSPLVGKYYWPHDVPREETIEAFLAAFRTLGYDPCNEPNFESGFVKVALYTKSSRPTHAARQLSDGLWTSKLGRIEDIVHHTLDGLSGDAYGKATHFLRRAID